MKPRCPVCGSEGWKCGTADHEPIPVDVPLSRFSPVGGSGLVRVETSPGVVVKMSAGEAAHYGQGPYVDAARAADVSVKKATARNKRRAAKNKAETTDDPGVVDPHVEAGLLDVADD